VFATQPAAHWTANPGIAGGVGPVNTATDLVDDPQVTHRHGLITLDDGARVLGSPIRIDGAPGDVGSNARGAAPELGGDTDDALAAAGYTPDEIAQLHEEGAV
jgi:crotonobetainyl-CoA:carnitine CoA-transferase CaiB-like acyl-CoA transferase